MYWWVTEEKKNITVCVLLAALFFFRLVLRNPEIIYVSQNVAMMDIVIKKPPLTKKGKIIWWEANEAIIKNIYASPMPDEVGIYYVNILDGGNGFKKSSAYNSNWFYFSKNKFHCFDKIESEERCFENNNKMTVIHDGSNKIFYLIDDEEISRQPQN